MAKLENILLQILGQQSGVNYVGNNISYNSTLEAGATSDEGSATFADVLTKLKTNLNKVSTQVDTSMMSYNPMYSSSIQVSNLPDISTIVSQIKNSKSGSDVDSMVKAYLLDLYGGSKLEVVKNFTGIQKLPTQITAMQDQIFNQIVTQVSIKVRENLYSKSADTSLFYGDESIEDSSSDSLSSIDLS